MSFFSRLRDVAKGFVISRRQREATERFKKTREGRGRAYRTGADQPVRQVEIVDETEEYEPYVEPERIYTPEELEQRTADSKSLLDLLTGKTVEPKSFIPGPDPLRLRSGDLLATAAFYGVTDEEYEALAQAIDTAYNDPAASWFERQAAINEIQDAMTMLHNRARETEDFDWARWREEVYGGRR